MQVERPCKYIVDISPLFMNHCSTNAVDMVSDYLGGYEKLTDISCHIGLALMRNTDEEQLDAMVRQVINQQEIDKHYIDMTEKVIRSFAIVLRNNFIGVALVGQDRNMVNHIHIHDAQILKHTITPSDVTTPRNNIATRLVASFHWHR